MCDYPRTPLICFKPECPGTKRRMEEIEKKFEDDAIKALEAYERG